MSETAKGSGAAHNPVVSTDRSTERAEPDNDILTRLRSKVAKQQAHLADAKAALAIAEAEGN